MTSCPLLILGPLQNEASMRSCLVFLLDELLWLAGCISINVISRKLRVWMDLNSSTHCRSWRAQIQVTGGTSGLNIGLHLPKEYSKPRLKNG